VEVIGIRARLEPTQAVIDDMMTRAPVSSVNVADRPGRRPHHYVMGTDLFLAVNCLTL
jgi:hypothetical protein